MSEIVSKDNFLKRLTVVIYIYFPVLDYSLSFIVLVDAVDVKDDRSEDIRDRNII